MISVSLGVMVACGSSEKEEQPQTEHADITDQKLRAEHIYVEVSPSDLSTIKKGDDLLIASDDSATSFTLNIRRVSESIPGIQSITAYVDNSETGQAALVLRDGTLSGQINLFTQKIRYQVGFDSTQNAHYVQQVHQDSLDVLEGGKPLVPKQEPVEN